MLPVLFTLPTGQPVYAYGVLLGLAVLLGFQLTMRRSGPNAGIAVDHAGNAFLIGIVSGLIGARLLYVAVNPVLIAEGDVAWWNMQSGGLLGAGGMTVGAIAIALYLRVKGANAGAFADAAAPAVGLFILLSRLGSYLYGSDFGIRLSESAPTVLKQLGTFPLWQEVELFGPPVLSYHLERYYLAQDAVASLPVHPVQLYEALLGLALMAWALLRNRDSQRRGMAALPVFLVFAAGRFSLEYLRADPDRGMLFGFTVMQLACLLLAAGSTLGILQLRKFDVAPLPGDSGPRPA